MRRLINWTLPAILLLALALRLWGIDFGLPYLYHPDEPGYITIAQRIFKTGDLNPEFFNYPSFFLYLNAAAYAPYYLVGWLGGLFHQPADVPAPQMLGMAIGRAPMATAVLLGRTLTAAFSLAAVGLLYHIGRLLTNRRAIGLLAALLLAVSPTAVANSRTVTPDIFVLFFALLAFWGAIGVYRRGRLIDYILAGVAAGLVASTKYNGALIVVALLAAHFLRTSPSSFQRRSGWDRRGRRDGRLLLLALALSGLTFIAATPFALLDFQTFWTDLRFEAAHYATGHAGMEGDALRWYLGYLWQYEGPVALLALLQIGYGLYRRSASTLLTAVFPVVYFLFISSFAIRNNRTLLPLLPFLLLLAAMSLTAVWDRLRRGTAVSRVVFLLLVAGMLAWPLRWTVNGALRLNRVDGRETARAWLADNLPPGSRVALESYSPFVDPAVAEVQSLGRMIDVEPAWFQDNGFDYLVFSQGMYGRFFRQPDRYAAEVARYQELFDAFEPVRVFDDGDFEIRIYRTP